MAKLLNLSKNMNAEVAETPHQYFSLSFCDFTHALHNAYPSANLSHTQAEL